MMQLGDASVLAQVVRRLQACPLLDQVVIATTTKEQDEPIVSEAKKLGVNCFRGSEANVLARYYLAAKANQAELVVRITADCPLYDPQVLTDMLSEYQHKIATGEQVDYLSNVLKRSFPRGLDTEIFPIAVLAETYANASQSYEQEHVTPYIHQHPEKFALHDYVGDRDWSAHRWTLDTIEDWQLITAIYNRLYQPGEIFTTQAVIELLQQQPELVQINAHVEQKKLAT
ncbi:glycosyltransferase family protein [Thalassoporum mexicanum]